MGRFKKGHRLINTGLWEKAGGTDAIVKAFKHNQVCEVNIPPDIWKSVTLEVFKTAHKEYTNWLRIIWREDRRGVQTAVLRQGKKLQLNMHYLIYISSKTNFS